MDRLVESDGLVVASERVQLAKEAYGDDIKVSPRVNKELDGQHLLQDTTDKVPWECLGIA